MVLKFPTILNEILDEVTLKSNKGLKVRAVFDLDSTLFDVSYRIAEILKEFANHPTYSVSHPEESAVLASLRPHPTDYGVRRTLERIGFPWRDMDFIKSMVEFWKLKFFSNEYIRYDQPYPGAVEFVNALKIRGAEIYYLTGRDIPRMKDGTLDSLRKFGFPISDNHQNLFLKPHSGIGDVEFKKSHFQKMLNEEDVLFFENEPANILTVSENFPHVKIVFVDTVHSGVGKLPPEHIIKIPGWII